MRQQGNKLKKLRRTELVEILLAQSERIDALNEENCKLKEELEKRKLVCDENGNLAEAALKLSGIFEAAQLAANDYLENIRRKNHESND